MCHDPIDNFTQTPQLYAKDKLQPSRPEPSKTTMCPCGRLILIQWP
jgi:hypothetical protein